VKGVSAGCAPTIGTVTYYEVLGVPADASPEAIRQAYVALARRHHPDFFASGDDTVRRSNERTMQEINEAWTVLSDPAARRRYDLQVGADGSPMGGGGSAPWRPFDESDDDEIDPRLLEDDPERVVVSRSRQMVTVFPALSFGAGVVLVVLGLALNALWLAVVGLGAVVVALLFFVLLPVLAVFASARNDRR
jgi:hypothetical protein